MLRAVREGYDPDCMVRSQSEFFLLGGWKTNTRYKGQRVES